MTIKDILIRAREIQAQGFTQGEMARDTAGRKVIPCSRRAVCWCPEGAILAVSYTKLADAALTIYRRALISLGADNFDGIHVYEWADQPGRTQEEVLNIFDRAIEMASTTSTVIQ